MNFFISFIIAFLFASYPLIQMLKKKTFCKYYFLSFSILLIGCFFRLFLIEKYPIGLNQDEASIGYEAYSLIQNGFDRNGLTYPVNFISWGSGQNALYAYLSIPFIKLLGLNVLSTRILMALVGCLTLLVVYLFTSKELKSKNSLIILFMLAIMPWHLMKSRWALESNIFPDLILYALIFIYLGIKYNRKKYYVFSSIILGISTYAYGTSYLFIPLLFIFIYTYLFKRKKIKIIDILLNLFVITLISFPLILYVIVNFFKLDTFNLGPITIPRLYTNRMSNVTVLNSNRNLFEHFFTNIINTIFVIIWPTGKNSYNSIPYFGLYYYISIPLLFYGIFKSFKSKNILLKILNIYFITCLILSIFTNATIVRINIIWLPIILYISYGMIVLINNRKNYHKLPIVYFVCYLFFITYYYLGYPQYLMKETTYSLDEVFKYTKKIDYKNMYITDKINQPYIYYLFYNKIDSKYYLNNRLTSDDDKMFQQIDQIGNVYFHLPKEKKENSVMIVSNKDHIKYECQYKKFKNYIIYIC